MRFSDFLLVSDPTDLDFIVGYTDEQNIRINVLDLFAGQIIGGGTPGYVPVFTAENVIDDSVIFQHGTNIVIGGVDSLGYKLAVSGSLYASNGAVINSTALGADALRVIAVDGDIFVISNDLGQSISSLRRIAHPPAVLTTESATLGQLNTAISNLEGDIEILLDLKVDKSSVGEPNGVASLDATGKIPLSEIPDSIIGQVEYMGTWNAFTNTPTLNPLIPEQKGHYYVVSSAGVFGGVDYQVGDWIISNGVEWQKVDNTDAVTSVFGRIGAILALEADYQSFYPRLSQAYDNPTWINTLAFSKITDVPPFLLENQTITLSGDVTGSGKTLIASTISNNAVTDSKLRDSVGTSVIGRASSTTGDPADIQASTDGHVLQRSGGTLLFGLISSDSVGSIDWSKIINTPTTLSGYGITNAYTKTEADNKFVPYTGANANVNLGSNNITANAFVKAGGTSAQFLKADGSVDVSQYVPTTRSVNAGTGLTGGGNLSSDITLAFDTTWGDTRYAYRTREIIAGTGLLGGGDLSANRTLSFDTVWGDARYLAPLAGYVPYTGATTNVNLGEFGVRAGYVQLDTTPTSTPTAQGTIYWDQDDNTIDAVLNGYIMKIGEDQFYPVKNQTGSPIAKGTAVRFAGTVGASGRLLIQPFIADGSVPSTYFMGVTAETIADGADGKVLWFGRIRGINTTAYNEGDVLYASTTVPGGFQTTVPEAPNNIVQIAAVITVHANNGTIFIRPTLGSNINKDEGVKITSPVVGQLLQLQSGNIWENKSLGQVIGGLSSQFLKGDGSLDSTSYVPFARQITINGTTYDLSADRTWNVGTVTSVGLSVPVGFAVSNSPITSSGNIVLGFDSGYSLPTNAKQLEWDTAYANRIASLTTTGTSGAATFISNVLNIPQYQAQGNYITNLTGEVTANGPGSVSATISNSAVIGKVLTGLSVTGSSILASDTILEAFGKLQGQVNGLVGGLQYQGTWNANTNTPTLTSGVGTDGHFYIVSVAGNTTIDGLSNWQVGDWIVFHTPSWQKVDNTESVTSVNGQVGAVNLSTTEIPEGTNLYFTNARSRQSISLTTTGSSGAATYNNSTGVFNIPQYSLSGLGGVPTTRSLTINGVTFDLSADRSWTVGDVRTDSSYANPSWITSLAWGKITGTPTTLAGYGITDAYTQTQVNNLLAGYVTLATDQTITGLKTIVRSGDVLSFKIGTDTLYGLKVAYNQNELVPSGEATWSFVNTFNRNGVGYEVTPLSFFRGVLVIGERLLTSSINSNLLDYYSNNPSGRYPVYAYNTGVQQFSTSILVGYTNGVVNASTGAISQLPSGVVANFNGRVIGQSAANSNEFVTLSQLGSYLPLSGGTMTGAITTPNGTFGIIVGDDSRLADRNVANTLFLEGVQDNDRGYINFSQTSGNALGAVNGGNLTWRGDTVWTSGNITPVTGTGTTNYLPKFTGSTTVGNSALYDGGGFGGFNSTGLGSRTFVINAASGRPLALELIENANVHSIFFRPNNSGYNLISSNYISGGVYLPLSLSARENNADFVLSASGNLGIGNTPSDEYTGYKLQIGSSSDSQTFISIGNSSSGLGPLNGLVIGNDSTSAYIVQRENLPLRLDTNNTERMRIFSDGNVLIQSGGTFSNNGARLQVSGASTFSGNLGIGGNTSTNRLQVLASNTGTQITTIPVAKYINTGNSFSKFIIGSDNANYDAVISMDNNATLANTKLRFYIGNGVSSTAGHSNDQIVLQGNGNVGIGTSSPSSKLEIVGDAEMLNLRNSTTSTITGRIGVRTDGAMQIYSFQSGVSYKPVIFGVDGGFLSAGNVLIGTTTDAGQRLQVNGAVRIFAGNVLTMLQPDNGNGFNIRSVNNGDFRLSTGGTPDALILTNGGAANFSNSLRIQGSTVPASGSGTELAYDGTNGYLLAFNRTSSVYLPLFVQGSSLSFGTGDGTTKMLINSSGNVLIGTTTDNGARLQVSGSARIDGASASLNFTGGNNRILFNSYRALEGSTDGATLQLGEGYSKTLLQGGNVLIGTTTDNGSRLQVSGAATVSGNLTFTGSTSTANADIRQIGFINSANSGNVKASIVAINGADSDDMSLSFRTSTSAANISEKLKIAGNGAATFSSSVTAGTLSSRYHTMPSGAGFNAFEMGNDPTAGGWYIYDLTTSSYRLTIKNGGNVLIGTTTDVGAKLYVDGAFRTGTLTAGAHTAAVDWRLGNARGGTATANALVRVQINGVLVDLIGNYV